MIVRLFRSSGILCRLTGSTRLAPATTAAAKLANARLKPASCGVAGSYPISIFGSHLRLLGTFESGIDYETASNETLESLNDHFEELFERDTRMADADVTLSSGVLKVTIPNHGTYVINKQTPNQQIWLSSPYSGPARFDLVSGKCWVYKHTGETLHQVLNREIGQKIMKLENAGFDNCYMGSEKP